MTNKEIDLLFTNGDFNLSFEHQIDYSEISGSYPTSIAFACAWGAKVIRDQKIEDVVVVGISKFNTILIVHEYCNNEKSLVMKSLKELEKKILSKLENICNLHIQLLRNNYILTNYTWDNMQRNNQVN